MRSISPRKTKRTQRTRNAKRARSARRPRSAKRTNGPTVAVATAGVLGLTASVLGLAQATANPTAAPAPAPAADPPAGPSAASGTEPPGVPEMDVQLHLTDLEDIAEEHDGNRAHGEPGYRASVVYVKRQLDKAGFSTQVQKFDAKGSEGYNLIADWPAKGADARESPSGKPSADPTGKPTGDSSGGSHGTSQQDSHGKEPGKRPRGKDSVVMAGGHLDSVAAGPGVNDNGTGAAALLEIAKAVAERDVKPEKRLRFAWWGAEEQGLLGSRQYVNGLSSGEKSEISAYLNFDMLGSPNPGYFVYDSSGEAAGSEKVQQTLTSALEEEKVQPETYGLSGSSDQTPFSNAGIPTGGIFSGAAERKTPEQAERWGGEAGEPFDPCYHKKCDTSDNYDAKALHTNGNAAMRAIWELAGQRPGEQRPGET